MTGDRTGNRCLAGVLLLGLVLTLALPAYLAFAPAPSPLRRVLRLPPCSMRQRLGIPCPLCFGTTTYVLIWQGQWREALRLDPFVFGLFWLSVGLVGILAFVVVSGQSMRRWTRRIPRRLWIGAAATVGLFFLINWGYLIATQAGVSPESLPGSFSGNR